MKGEKGKEGRVSARTLVDLPPEVFVAIVSALDCGSDRPAIDDILALSFVSKTMRDLCATRAIDWRARYPLLEPVVSRGSYAGNLVSPLDAALCLGTLDRHRKRALYALWICAVTRADHYDHVNCNATRAQSNHMDDALKGVVDPCQGVPSFETARLARLERWASNCPSLAGFYATGHRGTVVRAYTPDVMCFTGPMGSTTSVATQISRHMMPRLIAVYDLPQCGDAIQARDIDAMTSAAQVDAVRSRVNYTLTKALRLQGVDIAGERVPVPIERRHSRSEPGCLDPQTAPAVHGESAACVDLWTAYRQAQVYYVVTRTQPTIVAVAVALPDQSASLPKTPAPPAHVRRR